MRGIPGALIYSRRRGRGLPVTGRAGRVTGRRAVGMAFPCGTVSAPVSVFGHRDAVLAHAVPERLVVAGL